VLTSGDAAVLRAARPDLITVDISGFGQGGPYAKGRAYDLLIQAEAGSCAITGTPGQPAKPGIPIADIGAGMYALSSILAALFVRERTGQGTAISVGLFDSVAEWMGYALYTQLYTGRQPPRMGLSHSAITPYDAFPTSDGEVLIGVQNDSGWRTLAAQVLDSPELAVDPRFSTNVERVRHRAECDAAVGARTVRWTSEALDLRLVAAGIPSAQVKALKQVVDHDQLQARDRWRTIRTENAEVPALLPPITFADVEARMGDVPALGQQTHALLREAGFDAAAADEVIGRGIAQQSEQHRPVAAP